jgi:hypothetical protein
MLPRVLAMYRSSSIRGKGVVSGSRGEVQNLSTTKPKNQRFDVTDNIHNGKENPA